MNCLIRKKCRGFFEKRSDINHRSFFEWRRIRLKIIVLLRHRLRLVQMPVPFAKFSIFAFICVYIANNPLNTGFLVRCAKFRLFRRGLRKRQLCNGINKSAILRDLFKKMAFLAGPRHTGKTTLAKKIAAAHDARIYLNYANVEDRKIIKLAS